jgi:Protein of unknown function (DUF5132)
MTSQFDFDQRDVSKIIEGVTAIASAPMILLMAEGVKQPMVRSTIREGIVLSERVKEAIARIGETLEDLTAEAEAQLQQEKEKIASNSTTARAWVREGESDVALAIHQISSSLNEQVGRITNGTADLRLLMPIGLSALALRQILVRGFEIDQIPWYVLAWYAFDSFVKLNESEIPPTLYPTSRSGESKSD